MKQNSQYSMVISFHMQIMKTAIGRYYYPNRSMFKRIQGYYTTRPTLKAMCRKSTSVLRSAEILYTFGRIHSNEWELSQNNIDWEATHMNLQSSRWDTSLVAHHDGITGTSRRSVMLDYMQRLTTAITTSYEAIGKISEKLLKKVGAPTDTVGDKSSSQVSLTGNIGGTASFDITGGKSYVLLYHNSLAWPRSQYVQLRVNAQNAQIFDCNGNEISSQVGDKIQN